MNPLETYFKELSTIRSSGAAVKETSYYGPLATLFNEIGNTVKPKVRCIINLKNRGAGLPDGGLFTPDQFQKASAAEPHPGQIPSRGVLEVKGTKDDAWITADGEQVSRYWGKYRQVLVTNYRDFVLVGEDTEGKPAKLETFRLAESETEFWSMAAHPRKFADEQAERFTEYLKRVMLHAATLADPADVAWFLASYARDAKARMEVAELPPLITVRKALEQALGLRLDDRKGENFFRSTLVQTLFYGVFSAWVLWSKQRSLTDKTARFDWRLSAKFLRVPILRKLFYEVADPGQLEALNLDEVLDWTGNALNRVDRATFFSKFQEDHAVQYFYEPFLEAYDPELRKELGVWYTPREIVQYMVSRVDTVLREELNLPDGLADPRVYVLDPCCGTGAFLVEVIKHIASTLKEKGGDALLADDLKRAAMERIFGFEILPAPFVVSHLQLGLLLQSLGVPLSEKKAERVGVYLTNALTGWEPAKGPKTHLLFPELEEERDAAEKVKRDTPILVILGNPPYNSFAGIAVEEERVLSTAYRTTKQAPSPQGQGLNDLYVRFYRMAERRIVEKTGKGVVCFISNYSWLDGLSFTGLRERYLEAFDGIWIDCLNGDKYKTGKLTPDGQPDPSIFSTETNREGIQVGTAIGLLVRTATHKPIDRVNFRHLWGKSKRQELAKTAIQPEKNHYFDVTPAIALGLPFMPMEVQSDYLSWPNLPDLFPVFFPGVQAKRDDLVIDINKDELQTRMGAYFNPSISHEEMARICQRSMKSTARFAAKSSREYLQKRGILPQYFVRHSYRPFDVRWIYWEPETRLLGEKVSAYFPHVCHGNVWIVSQQKPRRDWSRPQFVQSLACLDLMDRGASCIPLRLRQTEEKTLFSDHEQQLSPTVENGTQFNLSDEAVTYLTSIGLIKDSESLFYHALAILHAPRFIQENGGGLRQDWPRIPLVSKDSLIQSAQLGRKVATLLDTETQTTGVTLGTIRHELKALAVLSREGGGPLNPDTGELIITAGWGHAGKGGITMPGKGKMLERNYTPDERVAIKEGIKLLELTEAQALDHLGHSTYDVYLNNTAYWKNVPVKVWQYTIGGYQVIKKWLSYREHDLLKRSLTKEEAREVMNIARRIAALLLLEPELDKNYQAAKQATYPWPPS